MARILLTARLFDAALEPLSGHEIVMPKPEGDLTTEEIARLAESVDAIVCLPTDRISEPVFLSAQRLAVVATVSVGYDHVDVEAATRARVVVCNTPGILSESTADLAFGLIIAASRLMSASEQELRRGSWTKSRPDSYLGRDGPLGFRCALSTTTLFPQACLDMWPSLTICCERPTL
jgi:glyoxylate reductase